MSPAALFVVGVVITLIVGSAVALLVYAAILDGRRQRELTQKDAAHVVPVDALLHEPATVPVVTPDRLSAA